MHIVVLRSCGKSGGSNNGFDNVRPLAVDQIINVCCKVQSSLEQGVLKYDLWSTKLERNL